jgi:hypothetical protein
LSARLAAEGVVYEVRGPSGAYPFGAAKVFVLRSDLEEAHLLLDEMHQLAVPSDFDDASRRRPPVVRGIAVVMVAVIVLSIVASALRIIFSR